MHNSRQCMWKRFKGRVQSWEKQMFVTRDEGGRGVGVTFFRSGRTRLEFTAIRVHNGRALGLDQVQRSTEFLRFNAFILQPPSTPPTRPPRFFLLLLLRLYGAPRHRSFFNILLSSYEDEARENARFNRVKWILEIFSGGGYLPLPNSPRLLPSLAFCYRLFLF